MRFSDFLEPRTARETLANLDGVETRDLYFWDSDDGGHPSLRRLINHILLYNQQTGKPIVPATKLYAVLEHREAFCRVLDMVMGTPDIPVPRVCVEDLRNTARLWLLFPAGAGEEENQEVGVRITNSYDLSVSLQGDLVIWVPVRDYAIVLSRTGDLGLPPLSLPHRAKAFEHLEERTAAFIRAAIAPATREAFRTMVDRAADDRFLFQSDEQKEAVLRQVFGKNIASRVAEQIPYSTTRAWLFWVMAEVAHRADVTPLMRDIFRQKAETFLRS